MMQIDVLTFVATVLAYLRTLNKEPIPQHNSLLTGQMYYDEVMNTDNPSRFLTVTRMDRPTFVTFVRFLREHRDLSNSMFICSGQKLMIFLHTLTNFSNRQTAERFQHSGSTISTTIHQVVESILKCRSLIFQPVKANCPIPVQISQNPKFFPFFKDCMGALDGSHIPAVVSLEEQGVFRNRKKFISQNLLAVSNFDMTFSYALAGWEGSAHDGRVFEDAKMKGLPLIIGRYYLGDAGYALSKYCLTPYRGKRYHLKEWARGNDRPRTKEELFNLRHSSLRNVIERIFGVIKKRFPILVVMKSFDFPFQCDIVICALLVHNFILMNQLYEDEFDDVDIPADNQNEYDDDGVDENNIYVNAALNQWRDGIATEMWDAYQIILQERGIL